jgi:hypothetical protein
MKIRIASITSLMLLGLAACTREAPPAEPRTERDQKTDENMRQAGRAAYDASQKAEAAAKELARQVDRAGKEAREGWEEAKREHEAKKP